MTSSTSNSMRSLFHIKPPTTPIWLKVCFKLSPISVLINVWNVRKSVLAGRNPENEMPSFLIFCDNLALRIVEELCLCCGLFDYFS